MTLVRRRRGLAKRQTGTTPTKTIIGNVTSIWIENNVRFLTPALACNKRSVLGQLKGLFCSSAAVLTTIIVNRYVPRCQGVPLQSQAARLRVPCCHSQWILYPLPMLLKQLLVLSCCNRWFSSLHGVLSLDCDVSAVKISRHAGQSHSAIARHLVIDNIGAKVAHHWHPINAISDGWVSVRYGTFFWSLRWVELVLSSGSVTLMVLSGTKRLCQTRNLSIANRSRISCARNTSMASIVSLWPWNLG